MRTTTWRVIRTPTATGAWNMALDEAILMSVGNGDSLPTLRLYSWAPPCLSLGYAQPYTDVDFDKLAERNWDIVRRPSGGRAILHTDELTYSIITTVDEPRMAGGVIESYRRLSYAIVSALNNLGVRARSEHEYSLPETVDKKGAVCFEVPSHYEITYLNKKLVGSAQVRRKDSILQHGTIPLNGDITRIIQVLSFSDEEKRERAKRKVMERAINLESILKRGLAWIEIADLLQDSFEKEINVKFQNSSPSAAELKQTEQLVADKFMNDDWTKRV